MINSIKKRDGRIVPFDVQKIANAIEKSFIASGNMNNYKVALELANVVMSQLDSDESIPAVPTVSQVQDTVERVLIEKGFVRTAKAYILYRAERSRIRSMNTRLMQVYEDIVSKNSDDMDTAHKHSQESDTAMGRMLQFGSEGSTQFYEMFVLNPRFTKAHMEGDIYIHDLDFYTLTTTNCQIDLLHLFDGGFSTGHGVLREPKDIYSYSALACVAIQANQNDQHGCQSIVNFDYGLAPGVKKTYVKRFRDNLASALELLGHVESAADHAAAIIDALYDEIGKKPQITPDAQYDAAVLLKIAELMPNASEGTHLRILDFACERAEKETDQTTYQAMKALLHNLNTMNSRAGAQVPISGLNYGMDTSPEGRMVVKNLLLATEAGLGAGETPTYPIQIFRVKEGISYNPGDPNYDLYRLAIRTSTTRNYPNFSFVDAPFNKQYYKEGDPQTEIAYMGSRTRVISNAFDPSREICNRRGNLSYTTINLPRIAMNAKGDMQWFFEELKRTMDLAIAQLDERFEIIAKKRIRNFPFLMGEAVWIDSETLDFDDPLSEALKHGTLSIGFIGLAEALVALRGKHHAEDSSSQNLGLDIIGYMRKYLDDLSCERKLNYDLLATPADELGELLVSLDAARFGVREGITDHGAYTDSFCVPASCAVSAMEKVTIEAPYHSLTNGGHICAIQMDSDTIQNLDTFEKVVRHMHDQGVGYGSISVPASAESSQR